MRKLIYILALWAPIVSAQCDVAISSWDAASGDIVIEAINSENCGCNEFTTIGNTCENSGTFHISNNNTVSHIVLGLHVEGLDYNWLDCLTGVNHAGWTFKVATLFGNQVLESGDAWEANVYDYNGSTNDCWAEILANDSLCTEIVVWQINLSQTATTNNGGWAVNPNVANQTQSYPDVNLSNNTAVNCALPACDTVYIDVIEYVADTIVLIEYVDVIEYLHDTIVLVETDTLVEYQYVYLTDTMYVETVVYEYVYVYETDTITEFLVESVYIDCATGEECTQALPCDEVSIFAPNAVTPNGDGWNDTWMVVADGACWDQWEVRVYNRWGGLVWISASSTDEWSADVAAGTYVYTITVHSSVNASVFEFNGTITVLY